MSESVRLWRTVRPPGPGWEPGDQLMIQIGDGPVLYGICTGTVDGKITEAWIPRNSAAVRFEPAPEGR